VWQQSAGFLALFHVASDNSVVIACCLNLSLAGRGRAPVPDTSGAIVGGVRRIRPSLTTSAPPILALIPALTFTGRGTRHHGSRSDTVVRGMPVALVSASVVACSAA